MCNNIVSIKVTTSKHCPTPTAPVDNIMRRTHHADRIYIITTSAGCEIDAHHLLNSLIAKVLREVCAQPLGFESHGGAAAIFFKLVPLSKTLQKVVIGWASWRQLLQSKIYSGKGIDPPDQRALIVTATD